jgi:hypothetical protein
MGLKDQISERGKAISDCVRRGNRITRSLRTKLTPQKRRKALSQIRAARTALTRHLDRLMAWRR